MIQIPPKTQNKLLQKSTCDRNPKKKLNTLQFISELIWPAVSINILKKHIAFIRLRNYNFVLFYMKREELLLLFYCQTRSYQFDNY